MRALLHSIAIVTAAFAAGGAAAPGGDSRAPSENVRAVAAGNREFGVALFKELASEKGNIFISPVSLAGAFGPVAAGVEGETLEAIRSTLRFPSGPGAHGQIGGWLKSLEQDSAGSQLSIANALWVSKRYPVKPTFIAVAKTQYDADVANLDFTKGAAAAKRINSWVSKQTNSKIQDLFGRDSLGAATQLVVTNAVYFLGDWEQAFKQSHTREAKFRAGAGSEFPIELMSDDRQIAYVDTDEAQMAELPYKGGRIAMDIILPKENVGLEAIEKDLDSRVGGWLDAIDSARRVHVLVEIPKLKIEGKYMLNKPLKSLGMGVAFNAERANFRGIAERDLVISQVIQKTFLKVDEKGTEAAAATGIAIEVTGARLPPSIVFRADRPFLILIREKSTGALLFLGRISRP
jgi:serpin B